MCHLAGPELTFYWGTLVCDELLFSCCFQDCLWPSTVYLKYVSGSFGFILLGGHWASCIFTFLYFITFRKFLAIILSNNFWFCLILNPSRKICNLVIVYFQLQNFCFLFIIPLCWWCHFAYISFSWYFSSLCFPFVLWACLRQFSFV